MSIFRKKRLAIATTVYWVLLAYIVAGLGWWFIALHRQNRQMEAYKLAELKMDDPGYESRLLAITAEADRKTAGYIGEGATFLLLILVAAIFVYREVRRQIRLQMQQQNFMMAVTHELKTPIAVTRLNLETMLKHQLDQQRQEKMLRAALQETGRLDTLANNILIASQLEGGAYHRSKEQLDLSALVQSIVRELHQRYPGRKWEDSIEEGCAITGDPLLLRMLVSNLVENAVKYAPKDSTVAIGLRKEKQRLVLEVRDEGPGIADEEKKKIFQKFYRTGHESTRSTQGTGLGLYLCRKIAHDHKASIRVADNSPVGSIFTVTF